MGREEFIRSWLEGKISSGDPDKKMREMFEGRDARDLKTIITRSTGLREPRKRIRDEVAATAVKTPPAKPQEDDSTRQWNLRVVLSLAAATAILAVFYFTFTTRKSIEAPPGQRVVHKLPDGSAVWLNTNSRIIYTPFSPEETRSVTLEGEGFFEVETGAPFKVEAENGTITVLGTSFNVHQTGDALEVACYSGVVMVADKNDHRVILRAGEHSSLTDGKLSAPEPFDKQKIAPWRWSGNVVTVD